MCLSGDLFEQSLSFSFIRKGGSSFLFTLAFCFLSLLPSLFFLSFNVPPSSCSFCASLSFSFCAPVFSLNSFFLCASLFLFLCTSFSLFLSVPFFLRVSLFLCMDLSLFRVLFLFLSFVLSLCLSLSLVLFFLMSFSLSFSVCLSIYLTLSLCKGYKCKCWYPEECSFYKNQTAGGDQDNVYSSFTGQILSYLIHKDILCL